MKSYVAVEFSRLHATTFPGSTSPIFSLLVTHHYGLATANASQWLWNFVVSKVIPDMITDLGYKIFPIFGTVNVGAVGLFAFFISETKGRSLEDTSEVWMLKEGWDELLERTTAESTYHLSFQPSADTSTQSFYYFEALLPRPVLEERRSLLVQPRRDVMLLQMYERKYAGRVGF